MINLVFGLIMGDVGKTVMVFGNIIAALCFFIWLPVVAFMVRWWWGVIVFFVPFGSIVFAIKHWQIAKKAFLSGIVFLGIAISVFVSRAMIALFFTVS